MEPPLKQPLHEDGDIEGDEDGLKDRRGQPKSMSVNEKDRKIGHRRINEEG